MLDGSGKISPGFQLSASHISGAGYNKFAVWSRRSSTLGTHISYERGFSISKYIWEGNDKCWRVKFSSRHKKLFFWCPAERPWSAEHRTRLLHRNDRPVV